MLRLQITVFLLYIAASLAQDCNTDADCTSNQFCSGSSSVSTPPAANTFTLPTNRTFTNETQPDRYRTNLPPVTSRITIFGKVRQQPNNNGFLLARGVDGIQRDYGFYLRSSHRQMWFIFNTIAADRNPFREQPWEVVIKRDLSVADGRWHTVAVTFDPATDRVEFFIDGILRAVEVETKTPDYSSAGPTAELWVGGRPPSFTDFTFDGDIEIARVYTIALTESQVWQVHQEAMNTASRQCINYQAAGQLCDLCGTANCDRRCGQSLVCVANPPSRTAPIVVPVNNVAFPTPTLEGTCRQPCNCTTSSTMQVCADDGLTYNSECFASCVSRTVVHNGTCLSFTSLLQSVYPA